MDERQDADVRHLRITLGFMAADTEYAQAYLVVALDTLDALAARLSGLQDTLARLASEDRLTPPDPDGALALGFANELEARRRLAALALNTDGEAEPQQPEHGVGA